MAKGGDIYIQQQYEMYTHTQFVLGSPYTGDTPYEQPLAPLSY